MRQRTHLFHRLEAIETMRAYVAHNVDENEDLLANLEMAKGEVVVAQQMVEEEVVRLRHELQDPRAGFDSLFFFTLSS